MSVRPVEASEKGRDSVLAIIAAGLIVAIVIVAAGRGAMFNPMIGEALHVLHQLETGCGLAAAVAPVLQPNYLAPRSFQKIFLSSQMG